MSLLRPGHLALVVLATLIPIATGSSALAAANQSIVVHHGQPSVLSQPEIDRLAADATRRSIIILKDQHLEAPARIATARRVQAVDADQAAIVNELGLLNARGVKRFHLVNAIAATISQAEIDNLSANSNVKAVVPGSLRAAGGGCCPGHA